MNECVSCANKVLVLAVGYLLLASGMVLGAGIQAAESIQFSFSPPGARSLALGGAFLGLADDATAAFTNPAGLVRLTRPEVSAEGRNSSYKTPYTDHGHLFGAPTGFGVDDVPGLVSKTTTDTRQELGFASFVYPPRSLQARSLPARGSQLRRFIPVPGSLRRRSPAHIA